MWTSDRCCVYLRQRPKNQDSDPGSLRELNMECFVQLADEKDFSHAGQLDFAANQVNTSTGTARIRRCIANKDRALASGLFVRVRVPVSKPYEALLFRKKLWQPTRTSSLCMWWASTTPRHTHGNARRPAR